MIDVGNDRHIASTRVSDRMHKSSRRSTSF
jgi:hypothetical protein